MMRLAWCCLVLCVALRAQNYSFIRVASEFTPRPDGAGPFGVGGDLRPAIEGNYVVFRDPGFFGSVKKQAIWSYNIATGAFIRLVDQETPAPGGTGNFAEFFYDSQPILKNGIVIFLVRDDKPGNLNQGIYSVPVAGGRVSRIANYNTPDPSGGTFANFDTSSKPFGGFNADNRIVFYGRNAANVTGLYSALPDGSGLSLIADTLHPVRPRSTFPVSLFFNGAVSGDTTVFYGQTVFDASTGFNALYTSPATGPVGTTADGSPNYREILTSDTQFPGNSNTRFHTRINVPMLQFDGSTIAFVADDSNSAFRGIFTMPVGGGAITPVVTPSSSLSGLGTLETVNSFFGISLSQGRVYYHAMDTTPGSPGNHGMFLWQAGATTRIIGTGDILDGRRVTALLNPGPTALSGDRMVFVAGLQGLGTAVYVAVPSDPAVRITGVANAASYANDAVSPGEIVTIFGTNIGPASLATFQLDAANRVPKTLAGARIFVNGNLAPPIYVSAGQSSAILPFNLFEETATLVAVANGRVSAPFRLPVAATVPGVFSADSSGAGQGAILNQNGSFNSAANPAARGSTIVLFGTGHGNTFPALEEAQVAPGNTRILARISATIGGAPAQIAFAGAAPGLIAGVFQLNVVIPETVASGNLPVALKFESETGAVATTTANLTVAVQ